MSKIERKRKNIKDFINHPSSANNDDNVDYAHSGD